MWLMSLLCHIFLEPSSIKEQKNWSTKSYFKAWSRIFPHPWKKRCVSKQFFIPAGNSVMQEQWWLMLGYGGQYFLNWQLWVASIWKCSGVAAMYRNMSAAQCLNALGLHALCGLCLTSPEVCRNCLLRRGLYPLPWSYPTSILRNRSWDDFFSSNPQTWADVAMLSATVWIRNWLIEFNAYLIFVLSLVSQIWSSRRMRVPLLLQSALLVGLVCSAYAESEYFVLQCLFLQISNHCIFQPLEIVTSNRRQILHHVTLPKLGTRETLFRIVYWHAHWPKTSLKITDALPSTTARQKGAGCTEGRHLRPQGKHGKASLSTHSISVVRQGIYIIILFASLNLVE